MVATWVIHQILSMTEPTDPAYHGFLEYIFKYEMMNKLWLSKTCKYEILLKQELCDNTSGDIEPGRMVRGRYTFTVHLLYCFDYHCISVYVCVYLILVVKYKNNCLIFGL